MIALALALPLSLPPAGRAGEYIVDQKHPQAADTNPGTESLPWKTIAHAAKTLQAGDIARIKAGRYRENTIQFAHSGERDFTPLGNAMLVGRPIQDVDAKFIALEAYGDGEAILDGSVELPAEGWTLVEGLKNVYVSKVELRYWPGAQKPSQIVWVYLNDRFLRRGGG